MINYIWAFILLVGITFGLWNGSGVFLARALNTSTESTIQFVINLTGMMCLWCGVMKVAEKSGLTQKMAKLLKPIFKVLFKDASKDDKALEAMVLNISANMMGLSNAATPYGIKAMEEMERLNRKKGTSSDDMSLFLVLNAACIQFIPTTILSIRASCNSQNPGEIIIPAIIVTGFAAIMGTIYCKILQNFF